MEGAFSGIRFPVVGSESLFSNVGATSKVTNMKYAFSNSVNPPVAVDFSGAVNMHRMYAGASINPLKVATVDGGEVENFEYVMFSHWFSYRGFKDENGRKGATHTIKDISGIFRNIKFTGASDYTDAWIRRQKLTKNFLDILFHSFFWEKSVADKQKMLFFVKQIKSDGIAYCGEHDWGHVQEGKFGRGHYLRPRMTHEKYKQYVHDCKRYRDAISGYYTGFNTCDHGGYSRGPHDYEPPPVHCEYHVDLSLEKSYPRKQGEVALAPNS